MVECVGLKKSFRYRRKEIEVLKGLDISIKKGEMLAVMGPSGCGKSTLLNIIGALIPPSGGEYRFENELVPDSENEMAKFRSEKIGFILQNFALIKQRTVFYNIALPLMYKNIPKDDISEAVQKTAKSLGIEDKLNRYPYLLSGGECQRTAIARAVIASPQLLLADEPTSSLDDDNKEEVFQILKNLNGNGITVIIATHDKTVAKICDRIIHIKDGKSTL